MAAREGGSKQSKGKKGRKVGRNRKKCERYRAEKTEQKNKAKRLAHRKRKLGHGPIKKPSKRSGSMGKQTKEGT